MSDIAIKVENLSKRYRIGLIEEIKDTFVGAISSVIRNPIKNLQKLQSLSRFGENDNGDDDVVWALKDVSFEVKKGEVIGVIGRNGAGKSTLLKILSKITHPTRGRVELNGRVASLLEVGTGFHPEMTGRENIYLNGTILGMRKKEIDRKLDEIVDFSGVEKFIDTPVKKYSSGMRMRLAFSVAAHLEPEILLIDEVLAVGDAEFQKKCLGKMGEVAKGGRTVLFVSHNMAAISALCKKSILIEKGNLTLFESTSEVINKYIEFPESQKMIDKNSCITDIRVKSNDNAELVSNKGFNVKFKINLQEKIKNLILHFTLRNSDNLVIFQERKRLKTLGEKYPLIVQVCLEFPPLNIKPGGYSYNVKMLGELNETDFRLISKNYPLSFNLRQEYDISAPGILTPRGEWHLQNMGEIIK